MTHTLFNRSPEESVERKTFSCVRFGCTLSASILTSSKNVYAPYLRMLFSFQNKQCEKGD